MIRRLATDTKILVLVFAVLGLMIADSIFTSLSEKARHAVTESSAGHGSKYFFELKNQLRPGSAVGWRRPILDAASLGSFDSFFLLGPRKPLSKREEKLLLEWVKAGGMLVLSFEDEAGQARIKPFLEAAGIRAFISDQPGFKNQISVPVRASASNSLFREGERYEFYSRLGFRDAECLSRAEACLFREGKIGDGALLVFAGIVPFANALIGRAENPRLATRLAARTRRAAIDEFHQFLTEKSMGDLLLDPTVMLPLAGFLCLALLYFFFGTGDFALQDRVPAETQVTTSYHALNKLIMEQVFANRSSFADAREWHVRALARMLPADVVTTDEKRSSPADLIRLHKKWLEKRGRKS